MNSTKVLVAITGFAVFVAGSAVSSIAQPPGGPGEYNQQAGGQGGFGRGPGGQGGPGGFGRQMPVTMGTITGGDAAANTIVITSQFGGGAVTIKVAEGAKIMTQKSVTVKDLKVGDIIQIQGVPTSITAASIVAGDPPAFLNSGRGNGTGQQGGPQGAQGQNGLNAGLAGQQTQATASASGKVVSLSPLTVSISDDVTLVLKVTTSTKISRYTVVPFSSLKVGDRLMASGQSSQDGTFSATSVGINVEMGGRAAGGFGGGPGGFGGPGGQGGPGGPQGQGGPGGQGGDGPPPPPSEQ